MRSVFYVICFFAVSHTLTAQQMLHVYKGSSQRLMANVTVQPGYTVYSLTRALGVSSADFVTSNPGLSTIALEVNTSIALPINPAHIVLDPKGLNHPIPLVYIVQPGESLYSICHHYAHQSIQSIRRINNKSTNQLSPQEQLILGWVEWPYKTDPTPSPMSQLSYLPSTKDYVLLENEAPRLTTVSDTETILRSYPSAYSDSSASSQEEVMHLSQHIKMSKGIAYWDQNGDANEDLIVMHPQAKVNSMIQLFNPMLNRTVQATVVGTIPQHSYPRDIGVIVSPSVASALGALDRRFLVEMTYVSPD